MISELVRTYKKQLYVGLAIVLVVVGFLVFQYLQFRITGTTPDHRNYPSSLSIMEIHFNRELDKTGLEKRISNKVTDVVSANFSGDIKADVNGSVLKLTFSQTPLAGNYQVSLKNIMSKDGSTLSKNLQLTVKDIDFDKMTKEEQKLYNADIPIVDDEHDAEFPILTKLPYETNQYKINYQFDHADPAPTLIITMKFFPPGNNAVPATDQEQAAYIEQVRTYRTEAINWLKTNGASPDDYIMDYTEPEIREEFPAGRGKYFDTGAGDVETTNDETNQ